MGSYSDSTSDLDEELPVFDFLQLGRRLSQASQSHTEKLDLDGADAEEAAIFSSAKSNAGACTGTADVMMISSESDDDAPYVPLAQRLKQKQDNVIRAPAAVTNGKHAEQYSTSNLASAQLSRQINLPESERPLSFHQVRTVNPEVSGVSDEAVVHPQRCLPPRPHPGVGIPETSPAKRKPAKRTAEEIQASREEALKRRQARERQQMDKEALRQEQERQKAERKALAEAAKALRPEECIKHIVVAVDPGKEEEYCSQSRPVGVCRIVEDHFILQIKPACLLCSAFEAIIEAASWLHCVFVCSSLAAGRRRDSAGVGAGSGL